MFIIDIVRTLSQADPYDDVIITDGEKEYEVDYLRIDNGYSEMKIKEKEKEK